MLPFDNEVIAYALAFTISTGGAASKLLTFMLCFLFVSTIIGIVLFKRQRWSSISWFRSAARSLRDHPQRRAALLRPGLADEAV